MRSLRLKHQLKSQGSSGADTEELIKLAALLERAEIPALDKSEKQKIASAIGFGYSPHRKAFIRTWEGAAAILIIFIMVLAQTATPGSALYPVRKGGQKVRSAVHKVVPFVPEDRHSSEDDHHSGDSRHGGDDNGRHRGGASGGDNSGRGSSGSGGSDDSSSSGSSGDGSGHSGSGSESGDHSGKSEDD